MKYYAAKGREMIEFEAGSFVEASEKRRSLVPDYWNWEVSIAPPAAVLKAQWRAQWEEIVARCEALIGTANEDVGKFSLGIARRFLQYPDSVDQGEWYDKCDSHLFAAERQRRGWAAANDDE